MRLKTRIKRLEAEVAWLASEGMARFCEQQLEILERRQALADHLAADPAAAARWAAAGFTVSLPPPSPGVRRPRPHPASPPRGGEEPERYPRSPSPHASQTPPPSLPEASDSSPPPGERAGEGAALPEAGNAAAESVLVAAVQPFSYDIPEHMQIRPITWRLRRPDEGFDDDDDFKLCPLDEDYDILADA